MKVFKIFTLITLSLMIGFITSCSNEFEEPEYQSTNALPQINSVTEAYSNQDVVTGVTGRVYFIKGDNLQNTLSVLFNGYNASVNPAYVTKNTVIVTIPFGTPFLRTLDDQEVSNKLILKTPTGNAEFNFSILSIESFSEGVQNGQSVVTISGGDFTNVTRVVFVSGSEELGNLIEKESTILSSSPGSIVAQVPDGVIQAYINVYIGNVVAVAQDSYGFNYPIFTDQLFGWDLGGWSGTQSIVEGETSIGSRSIRRDSDNWGGMSFNISDQADDLFIEDYRTVSFQIYPANDNTTRIAFAVNDFDRQVVLDVTPNQWNKFSIPLTDLYPPGTGPDKITRMDIQEYSGGTAPFLFYLDQFGFIE